MLAQAALVVDPCIDDDVRSTVITEEEPETAEELRPKPVSIGGAEGISLAVFGPSWIGRDHVEDEFREHREYFDVGIRSIARGIGLARSRKPAAGTASPSPTSRSASIAHSIS